VPFSKTVLARTIGLGKRYIAFFAQWSMWLSGKHTLFIKDIHRTFFQNTNTKNFINTISRNWIFYGI
jgi:hypothetical protein